MSDNDIELTDEQKQQLAEFDASARRWNNVQEAEARKRREAEEWANLGRMTDAEFAVFKRRHGL